MHKPERIVCIADSSQIAKRKSLCKKRMKDSEYYFYGIDHWFHSLSVQQPDKLRPDSLMVCPDCIDSIRRALEDSIFLRIKCD